MMGRRRTTGVDLARAINYPQSSLQRRLSGRYPFDVDLLEAIADHFGVSVTVFFPSTQTGQGHMTGYFPELLGQSDDVDRAA